MTTAHVRDFGAVDGTDSTTAIQAFLDHCHANRVDQAVLEGDYKISAGLVWGINGTPPKTVNYTGDVTLRAVAPIDIMVDVVDHGINGAVSAINHTGRIGLIGTGSTSFTSRTCRVGIRFSGCARAKLDTIHVERFSQDGVQVTSTPHGNSSVVSIGSIIARQIGSGFPAAGSSATATWSNPVNSGGSNSGGQRTTVTVDQMPPTIESEQKMFAFVGGEMYTIMGRGESTIDLYPWLDPAVGVSGDITYVFGSALVSFAADAAMTGVDLVDAMTCGIVVNHSTFYGPNVERVVSQVCGVAALINGLVTLKIGGLYCEGNVFDVVRSVNSTYTGAEIGGYAINPAKCVSIVEGRTQNSSSKGTGGMNGLFHGVNINFGRGPVQALKARNNQTSSRLDVDLTGPPTHHVYRVNSWTVQVVEPNMDMNRLYGFDSSTVTLLGTGPGNTPTGQVTFNPPSGWTVNGDPQAVFSGFDAPPTFVMFLDFGLQMVRVSRIGVG